LGFSDCLITGLGSGTDSGRLAPFRWRREDAESLSFEDDAFDFCVVHWGLHHCRSPHRAMLEMARVGRIGFVLFEPCDNLLTRLGVRVGMGQEYEWAAVSQNQCRRGGVADSPIPNYVYRWTTREVVKTVSSFLPLGPCRFRFSYGMNLPRRQLRARRGAPIRLATLLAAPAARLFGLIFPRQRNTFAAVVIKPRLPHDLHPWLISRQGSATVDASWLARRFSSEGDS
jgi:SAM-dependent methyltransferase